MPFDFFQQHLLVFLAGFFECLPHRGAGGAALGVFEVFVKAPDAVRVFGELMDKVVVMVLHF